MKLLYITTLSIFFLLGCQPAPPKTEPAPSKPAVTTTMSCSSDYQVYKETVEVWKDSWKFFTNQDHGEGYDKYQLFVKIPMLQDFLNNCPECTSVRAYFTGRLTAKYNDAASKNIITQVPGIVLINYDTSCNSSNTEHVLHISPDATYKSSFDQEKEEICGFINQDLDPFGLSPIYAYTYDRSSFETTIKNSQNDSVIINYALRTSSFAYPLMTGAKSKSEPVGKLIIDLVLENTGSEDLKTFYDFATPCPQWCGVEGDRLIEECRKQTL